MGFHQPCASPAYKTEREGEGELVLLHSSFCTLTFSCSSYLLPSSDLACHLWPERSVRGRSRRTGQLRGACPLSSRLPSGLDGIRVRMDLLLDLSWRNLTRFFLVVVSHRCTRCHGRLPSGTPRRRHIRQQHRLCRRQTRLPPTTMKGPKVMARISTP